MEILFNDTSVLSKSAQETLDAIRMSGIRFNIVKRVDFRTELFFESRNLRGQTRVDFVAELDGFGNVTEWGASNRFDNPKAAVRAVILDADGNRI